MRPRGKLLIRGKPRSLDELFSTRFHFPKNLRQLELSVLNWETQFEDLESRGRACLTEVHRALESVRQPELDGAALDKIMINKFMIEFHWNFRKVRFLLRRARVQLDDQQKAF